MQWPWIHREHVEGQRLVLICWELVMVLSTSCGDLGRLDGSSERLKKKQLMGINAFVCDLIWARCFQWQRSRLVKLERFF
jgi:hypothetical protein